MIPFSSSSATKLIVGQTKLLQDVSECAVWNLVLIMSGDRSPSTIRWVSPQFVTPPLPLESNS
jgi:hypothetical protein